MAKASKKEKPNKPQSKSYSPKRDKKELAKPLGWRFTDAGAKVLGVKANAKPTRDQIAKYSNKSTRKGDRYMYQEKRIDKSDMSQKAKFGKGGKVEYEKLNSIQKEDLQKRGWVTIEGITYYHAGEASTLKDASDMYDAIKSALIKKDYGTEISGSDYVSRYVSMFIAKSGSKYVVLSSHVPSNEEGNKFATGGKVGKGKQYQHSAYGMVTVVEIKDNVGDKKERIPKLVVFETVGGSREEQGLDGFQRSVSTAKSYAQGGEVARRAYNAFQSRTFEEQNAKIDQYKTDKSIDTPTAELAKDIDKAGQDHEFFAWYGSHYEDGGEAYARGGSISKFDLRRVKEAEDAGIDFKEGYKKEYDPVLKKLAKDAGYKYKGTGHETLESRFFYKLRDIYSSGKYFSRPVKTDWKEGDKAKLAKDTLVQMARRIPAQAGYTTEMVAFRKMLSDRQDDVGTITMVFDNSANLTYPDGTTIGIDKVFLVDPESQYEVGGEVNIPIGSTRSGDIEDRKKPSDFFAEGGELDDYDDPVAAREIELFAENDQQLYRSKWIPILKNYKKKLDKGMFDLDKAADGMKYYVDAADKRYQTEFGEADGPFLLSSKDRKLLSMKLAKFVKAEYDINKLEGYFEEGGIAPGQTSMFGAGGDVETFKREISLGKIDYNGRGRKSNEASLNVEIRNKEEVIDWDTLEPLYNVPEVTMSGSVWNTRKTDILSAGQMVDEIARHLPPGEKKNKFKRLVSIWKEYHNNDMKAGTIRQTEALEKAGITGSDYNYDKAVEHLKLIGLYEDNGYKYGHGWLYQPVPQDVLAEIKEIANQFPEFSAYEDGGEVEASPALADFELSDPVEDADNMYKAGGAVKIPNQEAREFAENRLPFQANNLEGKSLENGDYVVMSYGHYPIWYYKASEGQWYGNSDKYSNTTARHISQSRPDFNAVLLPHIELTAKMMEDTVKFDLGGVMIRQLDQGPVVDNTLIAHAGAANTTFR